MPPTPQQSYQHMAQQSPQYQTSSQPAAHSSYPNHGYSVSFDAGQHPASQPAPNYAQSFPNGPVSNPGFSRSFGDQNMKQMRGGYAPEPQIYTAVYSGVSVYELEVHNVAVMRRRSDGWLNATQILKVAGVDKGKRTKVLEKEILPGEHEKVQGGYGKYQGTWISYQRGREFCRQYGVEDLLRPLLDYDVSADGTSGPGAQETPTKEQAMAAQRKKFYNSSAGQDPRPNGQPQSNGTFFSNISPTTSVALAAMNKAARLNSPRPRPSTTRRPSSQQDPAGSQYSDVDRLESGYNTQPNGEPPRKRMRHDDQDMGPPELPLDASMRSMTPTEPNESFLYEHALMQDSVNSAGEPIALPPLPNPTTEEQQEKMNLILDLFAEQGRTDYASHPALQQLTNEDFNMPLDASANNALHWAATLAKVPLLRLLIQKGASIWRGNAAGQSPLISAVLVSNCWEHSCFPEVLELLGPLIEVRDVQGRTILHHIAVSSGIKGRQPCSKYYLEALLEFLVRIGTQSTALNAAQEASQESSSQEARGPVSLVRFLSHIVNARDKAGNTALNLVARIGNRSIIQQLLEIHADPSLPNNKGVCAKDFGVGVEPGEQPYPNGGLASQQDMDASNMHPSQVSSDPAAADGDTTNKLSQAEDLGQDFVSSMTSMFTQNLASHKELLRNRAEQIDQFNEQIRELSAIQREEVEQLHERKERVRLREERQVKIANLRREIEKKKATAKRTTNRRNGNRSPSQVKRDVVPGWLSEGAQNVLSAETEDGRPDPEQRHFLTTQVPPSRSLQARINAFAKSNAQLEHQAAQLRSRSTEVQAMYRKVVSMCTGVPERDVEQSLPALVAAVESEQGSLGKQDVGRVRDFLRRVDGGRDSSQPKLEINHTISQAAQRAAVAAAHAQAGKD
ncbi:unnamed protein product [Zymoseptoria tritici ST99CH_3D7]|uniref:HTH APSES-type domain-containing protein n=2 Tax=Zymoseptoria tritici TaxID=1047171 RepID=A0A1X7S556_ZYMT9|nr:unnamed protein product [Zymoseptoria tritici ST99CH_3D7]SMR59087.1 unnamed protein product [Zymoseptoria tritici ST99CH_1E4]